MATKLLSDLVSGVTHVPSNYVRPAHDRPNLDLVQSCDHSIPLINLQGFDGSRRSDIVKQIGLACQDYGFFQVHIYLYINIKHALRYTSYSRSITLFNESTLY